MPIVTIIISPQELRIASRCIILIQDILVALIALIVLINGEAIIGGNFQVQGKATMEDLKDEPTSLLHIHPTSDQES
jgi:hypothetical protein